jgi:hypothetical protein
LSPEPKQAAPHALWALLVFTALAIFWTWPLAANLSGRIPHDPGDPVLNTWILWWNAQAVPFTTAWWNAPMLWPMPDAMALSEHLAGLSVFATPLQILGASPNAAYNVCVLITYVLSGFLAFLLTRHLTGSTIAGFCGGLAFGFSPYRASQLAHIQVLASQWMPLALLALHAFVRFGGWRWLLLFAVAWVLQALSNGYYLLFFPILGGAWLLWFVDWRTPSARQRGLTIVAVWIVSSLPLVPLLLKYQRVHTALGLTRTIGDIRQFSAEPSSFLQAPPLLKFWPTAPATTYEQYLFPGATLILLAAAGLALALLKDGLRKSFTERSPILFYTLAMLLMWSLALGPGGDVNGPPSRLHPYTWLLTLPGFNGVRAASRFAMLGSLCLAAAASLSVGRLLDLCRRWRVLIASLAIIGIAVDGVTDPLPVVVPPGRSDLPGPANGAVIELPADQAAISVAAMYRSMFHRRPLVNGYSGHTPPHYKVLTTSMARGDYTGLLYLARGRPLAVAINDIADPNHELRTLVESIPGIERHGVSRAGSLFLVPAQPLAATTPAGDVILRKVRDAGRYRLEFDTGSVQPIAMVAFPLRRREGDLSDRLRVQASDDGMVWRDVWAGWTGGIVMEAVLTDPAMGPVKIPLLNVAARYVSVYPASPWMKDEVQLRGR